MKLILIGSQRRDGKQKVKIIYPGAPNMFGGHYPPTVFTKLFDPEKVQEYINKADEVIKQ